MILSRRLLVLAASHNTVDWSMAEAGSRDSRLRSIHIPVITYHS